MIIKLLKNYKKSIGALFSIIFILYYPMAVTYLDCFKDEKKLRNINVVVLDAQTKKKPNIKALSSDNRLIYLDFPSGYSGIKGWGPGFIGKKMKIN